MFKSARIKLTAFYLLIIMTISLAFSGVVYELLSNEFERFDRLQRYRIEKSFDLTYGRARVFVRDPDLLYETKTRLAVSLAVVDLLILITSGILGYFLAGKTLKPIQNMVDEQNRFISDASHELRTPLTALKSSFEVFLRDKNSTVDEARTLIKSSIEDVEALSSLSDSLLQLAQYETVNMMLEGTSLAEVLKSSVERIKPLAVKKNVKIELEATDAQILANKFSLTDLFVILLDNAIKYSSDESLINVKTLSTDGHIVVSVADQGYGIPEKDIPHIFERFYRADASRSKNSITGYGLGLSIAKRIVTLHKGSIWVESAVNKGSTFFVKLAVIHSANIQKEQLP